jgi:hypothetical protein
MLRYGLLFSTLSMAVILSLTTAKGTTDYDEMFKCLSSNFKSDGTKEDRIKKYLLSAIALSDSSARELGNGSVTSPIQSGYRSSQTGRRSPER